MPGMARESEQRREAACLLQNPSGARGEEASAAASAVSSTGRRNRRRVQRQTAGRTTRSHQARPASSAVRKLPRLTYVPFLRGGKRQAHTLRPARAMKCVSSSSAAESPLDWEGDWLESMSIAPRQLRLPLLTFEVESGAAIPLTRPSRRERVAAGGAVTAHNPRALSAAVGGGRLHLPRLTLESCQRALLFLLILREIRRQQSFSPPSLPLVSPIASEAVARRALSRTAQTERWGPGESPYRHRQQLHLLSASF